METPNMSLGTSLWKYHVFLSFRGEDTRFKFIDHLYQAFCRAGINAFRDEEGLRTGEKIGPSLLSAIEESRISIVVFSQNYASSSWCLDELVKILECKKEKKQLVLPIFYEVDPSEVRHQTGSFHDAMVMHEKKYKDNIEKVQKWKSALRKAANLSGESYKKESESKFVDKIIQKVSSILGHPLLHLPEQAIGLECRKSLVVSLLSVGSDDVRVSMVGICGIGGVGKTTIAKAVYNSVGAQFASTSFYADVRENTTKHGLAHIQQSILADMLGEKDINLSNIHRGIQVMKERLHNKRVLLVLDDVDNISQIQSLAGGCNWFGAGSRVIITTRDKQLLRRHGIESIYEVKELDEDDALELLCWNAFKRNQPNSGFEDVATRVLSYARGIPLALEIIGSHLFGKDIKEWECALDAYKKSMDNETFGILKVSYESLEYNEKEIFLDIACFFNGREFIYVKEILGGCGFSSKSGLSVLEDRCLVKRQDRNLWMHDLTQSMGREIVRRESEREPGKRSRIWFHGDALQVLTRDTGSSKVEGLMLELPQRKEVIWSGKAFKKMVNLRILIIRKAVFSKAPKELPNSLRVFVWEDYPSSSLPSNFYGNELLDLCLTNAPQTVFLQEPFKNFQNITTLTINFCKGLKEVPDVSAVPNLTHLCLTGCENLIKIHDSVGSLDKLKKLSTINCFELKEFPVGNVFKSLQVLNISGCRRFGNLPFASTTLMLFALNDAGIDFQSDSGSGLIQALMECYYSILYYFSGARIPRCFSYRRNKNSISFWVQNTFPDVHVSFAFRGPKHDNQRLILSLSMGHLKINQEMMTHHTGASAYILWLPCCLPYKDYLKIHKLLKSENWVRVDIRMFTILNIPRASTSRNHTSDAFVMECGVYVSCTCDTDFSFVNPYSQYSFKNKSFTGRSAEHGELPLMTFEQNAEFSSSDLLWKKIMYLNVPPQVKHFAWTAISDYLPIKWNWKKKGKFKVRERCQVCGKRSKKIALHVLKNCQWTRGVWLLSPLGLRVDRMEANNLCEWILKLDSILDTESLELLMMIAWGIWNEREKLYLGLKTEDPSSLIRKMCCLLVDYRTTHRPTSPDMQTDEEIPTEDQPLFQPVSQDGDQHRQKKKGKHKKSMDKGKQVMVI